MKFLKRVLSKVGEIPFRLRGEFALLMIGLFFFVFISQVYLTYENEGRLTKNNTESQLNYVYDSVKNKFDLAHMHIALDYNVTQTIFDSAESLRIPSTQGVLLLKKSGDVIYETGDITDIPTGEFIALSRPDHIYIKIPIFTPLNEYSLTIKLKNIYKTSVQFLAGDSIPTITVPWTIVNKKMIIEALNWAGIFSLIVLLAVIIWSMCVSIGSVLHDQGQYNYLYRVLATEIKQLATNTNVSKEINKATNIIDFVSTFNRESAARSNSSEVIDLVIFLNTIYEAYKYNFENIIFYTTNDKFQTSMNKDALACVVTNMMQNSVIYVSKLPPSLAPDITMNLIIKSNSIVVEISNTFLCDHIRENSGLGFKSMSDVCSDNGWGVIKSSKKGRYTCTLSIPRRKK